MFSLVALVTVETSGKMKLKKDLGSNQPAAKRLIKSPTRFLSKKADKEMFHQSKLRNLSFSKPNSAVKVFRNKYFRSAIPIFSPAKLK